LLVVIADRSCNLEVGPLPDLLLSDVGRLNKEIVLHLHVGLLNLWGQSQELLLEEKLQQQSGSQDASCRWQQRACCCCIFRGDGGSHQYDA